MIQLDGKTYHQQKSFCGKTSCVKCREGIGHGPYWYVYELEKGKTIRRYVGKTLPEGAQTKQEALKLLVSPKEQIRLYTLGQFRVEVWSSSEGWKLLTKTAWQQQRVRSTLGCLVAAPNHILGREQLIELLWPTLELSRATARLDRAVYELRELFEPKREKNAESFLQVDQGILSLSQVWIDADAFELFLAQAWQSEDGGEKERLLLEARSLYAGHFLQNEEEFPSLSVTRERILRGWIALLMLLADLQSGRQALPEAIESLHLLVRIDPLNEGAVQRLMRLLWQVSQRDKALLVYKRLAALLQREHALVPLPETRSLYEAISRGFAVVSSSVPQQNNQAAREILGRTHQRRFIGRQQEQEEIRGLLALTEQYAYLKVRGQKQVPAQFGSMRFVQSICITGEVGIGKTRLAEEVANEARQQKWMVVWSRAYQVEVHIPYRLWMDLLRQVLERATFALKRIKAGGILFRPLGILLPGLLDEEQAKTPLSSFSLENERFQLWEAILELLRVVAEQSPLLLVLDDLQWADESSCELLVFLMRRIQGIPIFFLVTCREYELSPHHSLQTALPDLQRQHFLEMFPLSGLNVEEIEQLIALVPVLPVSRIPLISQRAQGNPYFAEELARSIQQQDTLPETIAAALELRLKQLSVDCLRLLSKVSVLRESFSFEFLAALEKGISEDMLLEVLEEAINVGMISEEGTVRNITYRFWHPLLAQYLYERLSSARRAALHRQVVEILGRGLSEQEQETQASTLLFHLEQSGAAPAQIAKYAELAGNFAYRMAAYSDAEQYYQKALNQGQDEQQQNMHLWERLSECARIHGSLEIALDAWKRVLELHTPLREKEPYLHGALLIAYAQIYYDVGLNDETAQLLDEAEKLLIGTEGPAWGLYFWQKSCMIWMQGDFEQAEMYAQKALISFQQAVGNRKNSPDEFSSLRRTLVGDPVDIGRTLRLLSALTVGKSSAEPLFAMTYGQQALTIFEQCQRKREVAGMLCDLGNICLALAEYEKAEMYSRRSLKEAEALGDRPIRGVLILNLGIIAYAQERYQEAQIHFEEAIRLVEEINDLHYVPFFASYYALRLFEMRKEEGITYMRKALRSAKKIATGMYASGAFVVVASWLLYRAEARKQGKERARLLQSAQMILTKHSNKLDSDFTLEATFLQLRLYDLSGEAEKVLLLLQDLQQQKVIWAQQRASTIKKDLFPESLSSY